MMWNDTEMYLYGPVAYTLKSYVYSFVLGNEMKN